MIKKILWAFLGLILVAPIAGSLVGIKMLQFQAMGAAAEQMVMPPEPVTVAEVRSETWQPRISSVGSVVAVQGTMVSTEADGVVRQIAFKEGTSVNAGDVLIQLDIEMEQAQLRAAEAAAELALASYNRSKELIATKTISQQEFDSAQVELRQAIAQVENLRAVIAKKTVRAPFAGKLGIRSISIGQYLDKGSPVVSLQALDPVRVEFSLPQQKIGELAEGLSVSVTTDSYPDETFQGQITAINPDIDVRTRNLRAQATLPNADSRLRPGMFVTLEVIRAKPENVLFIPATAVNYAPYGDSVFLVEEDGTTTSGEKALVVRQQFVRLGARQGDFVIATEGVKAGDRLVSTGVFKMRPGLSVVIDNKLAPEFKLEPKPKNT